MGTVGIAPDPWSLRFRIARTVRFLSGLAQDLVAMIFWDRLMGRQTPDLPLFEFHERGGDLFIDVVDHVTNTPDASIAVVLQAVCALLLDAKTVPEFENVEAVGELVYVAARIESKASIRPISRLIGHAQADEKLTNGETIRQRAIRALVGLLSKYRDQATDDQKAVLMEALGHGDSALMAVAGLVAVFREDRDELLTTVHSMDIRLRTDDVDLSLRLLDQQNR